MSEIEPDPSDAPQPVEADLPSPDFLSAQAAKSPAVHDEIFWGWHDFFLFVFMMVVALGAAMWAASGIKQAFHWSETRMNIVFVGGQFAAYGIAFTGLKFMFRAEYDEPMLRSLRWLSSRNPPVALAVIGLGQALMIKMIGSLMHLPQTENPMSKLMADRPTAMVLAVLAVTLAPVAEELAFRGLLQPLMIRVVGVIPGILVTASLFGLMHFEQYASWQSVVLIGAAGAGFGVMRHLTGSTKASAIMHAGYNSALFMIFFTQKGPSH